MEIRRLAAKANGLCLLLLISGAAAWGGSDPPIERMEASTVRVIVRDAQGEVSTGSGFIVGDGSYVVTNHHVVAGAEAALVLGKDLKVSVLKVAADDDAKDLAILQLKENSGRPAVVLGLRNTVKKTQTVLAAGFPGAADDQGGGIEDFVEVKFTRGIISAFVKSQSGTQLYQIDAPINPGNSGGPLFNECGAVIGIDAMKSLRPTVVVGSDGRPTAERMPYGEGVAWAIQSDELLVIMRSAGIAPNVSSNGCDADAPSRPNETAARGSEPRSSEGAQRSSYPYLRLILGVAAAAIVLIGTIVAFARSAGGRAGTRPRPPAVPDGRGPVLPPLQFDVRLRGISGSHAGMEFPVTGEPLTLGRDPSFSQIVFDAQDSVVSKRHCIVRFDPSSGGLLVEDCGSRNGTFLDSGERLRRGEPRLVRPYGSFYLGDRSHAFQVQG